MAAYLGVKFRSGLWLHAAFWIVYFSVNLFNELYLSSSFTAHPSSELLFDSVKAQLLLLAIKFPAVYYVLYSLIPRWAGARSRFLLLMEFATVFIVLLFCYRGLVQFVIWPYIVKETAPQLTTLQYIARFFYSLMDLLQVTGIAAAIRLFRLRIAAVRHEKLLMKEKLQSEMQHLRAQINPHFLFNTLNSVYALSRSKSDATPDVVMRLSTILRYMLYATEKKLVPIEDELAIAADYISLQQTRFGKKVQVRIEEKVDQPSTTVPPQVLLPLVENAFKHGTTDVSGATEIFIRIHLEKDRLFIETRNAKGSSSATNAGTYEGIGLQNLRRRLQMSYRDFQFGYGNQGDIFVVELSVNLSSYADFELSDH